MQKIHLATEDRAREIVKDVLDNELEERIRRIILSSPQIMQLIKGGIEQC